MSLEACLNHSLSNHMSAIPDTSKRNCAADLAMLVSLCSPGIRSVIFYWENFVRHLMIIVPAKTAIPDNTTNGPGGIAKSLELR